MLHPRPGLAGWILRSLTPAAAVAAVVVCSAAPAGAQALEDRYWLQAAVFRPKIDTSASFSRPNASGTELGFENELGFDDTDTLPAVTGGFRFGERWMVVGEFFGLDRDGSTTLTRDINFDGSVFPATAQVSSNLKSDIYRISLGYALLRSERSELGVSIGLHATNFDVGIQGQTVGPGGVRQTEKRAESFVAPLPTIGLYGTYEVAPNITLNGRVDYLSLTIGDYSGGITNLEAAAAYRFSPMFAAGVSWRYVAYDLEVNKDTLNARLDYNFSGPTAFVRMSFQ
jgi:hypothetical protein